MDKIKILFMGTGDIALPSFAALLESDYDVVGLFTQPDKPVGRKQLMTPPVIKVVAEENGIRVWQPERLRGSDELDVIEELAVDVIVVMAYGQILPTRVIDAPRIACINLHASLLPKYRGASCIQGAIDAGDAETGISVMHVAPALDEGDVILQHRLVIQPDHTGGVVHDILAESAPAALLEGLDKLVKGTAERHAQDSNSSNYAPKLMRDDGELDWGMSAAEIARRIRAYDPWPGTSTTFLEAKGKAQGKQKRLKIFPQLSIESNRSGNPGEVLELSKNGLVIACGIGAVRCTIIQPEGSARMTAEQFATGGRILVGDILA
ncbi:MAG: methionyl-tRNA formyltransferase [Rubritalea sp.]